MNNENKGREITNEQLSGQMVAADDLYYETLKENINEDNWYVPDSYWEFWHEVPDNYWNE